MTINCCSTVRLTALGRGRFRLGQKPVTLRLVSAFERHPPVVLNDDQVEWFGKHPDLLELESLRAPLVLVPSDHDLVVVAGLGLFAALSAMTLRRPIRLYALLLGGQLASLGERELVDLFRTLSVILGPPEARSHLEADAGRALTTGGWIEHAKDVRRLLKVSRQAVSKAKRRSTQITRRAAMEGQDRGAVASRVPRHSRRRSPASHRRRAGPRPKQMEMEFPR